MKVCVFGLWHLGTVTAACLASGGHQVIGLDFDPETVTALQAGIAPIFEPQLTELLQRGLAQGTLSFSTDPIASLSSAEVVWVTYDTPVDEDDRADVELVVSRITDLFSHLQPRSLVLISSQVVVGTTAKLRDAYAARFPAQSVSFAYSPENLRLGKAIEVFTRPDRVVVGVRNQTESADKDRISKLLVPFTERIEWMSIESAEMTKHALNAFLATSVAFTNEVANLCEHVGADAKEVERGLKSDIRIGPRAYLMPGSAFAGGTLARDISFLESVGAKHDQRTDLISAAAESNRHHRNWIKRKLECLVGELEGRRVAVWGLTYKSDTNTLRRSDAVQLCTWLKAQGAHVQAYDPSIKALPPELTGEFELFENAESALRDAAALVISTDWPEYQSVTADGIVANMRAAVVIDPNRFLERKLAADKRIRYAAVGKPAS